MSFYDYEIGLEVTETKEYYHDVSYCSFLRTPIFKQATYCILQINLPPILLHQIRNDISDTNHPKFNLTIYLVDRQNDYNRIKQIFYKNYLVLNIKATERETADKKRIQCKLILVNPILYYMNNNNTYNIILKNKTAYQAIQDYEQFIKKIYGNTFYSNHIIDQNNINNYIYEQILIRTINDLNVPTELINVYKPFHSFNYYFFDDFNLSSKCDKDISCTYLNLFNKDVLTKFDINEFAEICQNLKMIKTVQLNDNNYELTKNSESFNFNHQEIVYESDKSVSSSVPKQDTQTSEETELVEKTDRKINLVKSSNLNIGKNENPISQSSQQTIIYSPDSIENSKLRYKKAKELLNKKFENLSLFESINSYPDWLQFGKLYNFELDDQASFYYTPFSIINIFQRKVEKEHYLNHIIKFSCLKFYS